jgi:hypothetical protein
MPEAAPVASATPPNRLYLDWQGNWTDYGINAAFLENYWNQGSVKKQARWFDDFVISSKPVGPITALQPATLIRKRQVPSPLGRRKWLPIQMARTSSGSPVLSMPAG